MHTRSSSNLIVESSTIPKRRNHRHSKQIVKPELRSIVETPVATMADTRTMSELLQAPTEGYGDAIVIPAILAKNFELKVGLLQLVTSSLFHGFERDDPHAQIRWFNKITSTLKYKNVPHDAIKLMLFPFSFEGAARIWLEKEPPCSILTWEDLVSKFVNYFFPPSKTTNLKNDITNFQQKLDETFSEAWDRFKDLLRNTFNASAAMGTSIKEVPVTVLKETRIIVPSGSGSLPSNTIANPIGDVKAITTRSGVAYDGPTIPPTPSPLPKEVERETELTKDKVQTTSSESTIHVQPSVVQVPILGPEVSPKPNPKLLHFDLSFADALLHMPKFASTFKSLLSNKEKLFELASTPLNENCSAVLLKKLPKKLRDPGKFLIPCDFPKLDECLALADLCASINLMPLSVWKKLSLPELTPTRMTLELANRSFAYLVGVAEDVFVKVGKFHFPADFVVVDYDVDPRVPLILGRPFLRTAQALIDVHGEELILRDGDEQLIFHTDTTSKYPNKHRIESKLSHHLSDSTTSTPDSSPSLTPVKTSDSLLEEFADELALLDPFPPRIDDDDDFDPEGDILLLEKLLNDDPSSLLPPKELNFKELKMIKSSIDDFPPLNILGGNFVTFSNPLFDANDDFTFSDDESLLKEDVQEENFKIYSNPLFEFDIEYISSDVNPLFNEELEDIESNDSYVSNLDEPVLSINAFLDMDVSTVIEVSYHDSEGDKIFLEYLLKEIASMDSYLLFSSGSEDIIFEPGIPIFSFYSLKPVDCPDYEDSRARGFVHRSLELQSLACLYMGI
ncbi:reverse transcriptase domain-containing protein [Tanacetum coccineum]